MMRFCLQVVVSVCVAGHVVRGVMEQREGEQVSGVKWFQGNLQQASPLKDRGSGGDRGHGGALCQVPTGRSQ